LANNKAKVKKPVHLLVSLVLAVVALSVAVYFYFVIPTPPQDAEKVALKAVSVLDQTGRDLVAKKKYDEAIAQYCQALTIFPGDYNLLMDRAQAYYKKKDYQAALTDYQTAQSAPSKAQPKADTRANACNALLGVALCQAAMERQEMAIKTLHQLQAKDGHFIKAFQVLGDIYLKSDNSEAAIDAYTQGLRLNPDSTALHYDRALAYLKREMRQQAFDDLSRAIEVDTSSLPMYLQHANLANKMGKAELADDDAREILRLEPDNRSALAWLKKRGLPVPAPASKTEEKLSEAKQDSSLDKSDKATIDTAKKGGEKVAETASEAAAKMPDKDRSQPGNASVNQSAKNAENENFTTKPGNNPAEKAAKKDKIDSMPKPLPETKAEMKAGASPMPSKLSSPQTQATGEKKAQSAPANDADQFTSNGGIKPD
jgi:tetratricopeptide (TPR) repeat protein